MSKEVPIDHMPRSCQGTVRGRAAVGTSRWRRHWAVAWMRALGPALLVMALVAPSARAAGGEILLTETRTTSFPRVSLRMSISDSEGVPVGDLRAADFEVRENGQAVRDVSVQTVQKSATPLSIVMAVDVSGSMKDQGKLDSARDAANTFIAGLRRIDQVQVISFSTTVSTVVGITSDRAKLAAGLQKLTPAGDTALYDAVFAAVSDASRMQGNRVVMVLTDGEDTASKGSLQQATDLAVQLGIPVYTIGLGQEVKDDVLRGMAEDSLGKYLKAPGPGDLAYTFRLLSQQIQNQYELTYMSPLSERTGGSVEVSVTARVGGQPVATRFSYEIPRVVESGGLVETGQLRRVPQPETPSSTVELPPYLPELAALLAGLGVLALLLGLLVVNRRTRTESRLESFVGTAAKSTPVARSRLEFNPVRSLSQLVYRLSRWFLPKTWLEDTRDLLIMAGQPRGQGAEGFLGLRVLLTLGLAGVGFLLAAPNGVPELTAVMALAMGGIGFILPLFLLKARIKDRQWRILRALPNALDLLSVSVEAGLGFDQALVEVCTKWQGPLAQEFTTLLNDMRLGSSRRDALRGLARRTGVPELNTFASAIIQADELGASLVRTLQNLAEEIRIRRRQRAQEQAHQAPVKMAFPLVFFMLPALFVVILGPAVPSVLNALSGVIK